MKKYKFNEIEYELVEEYKGGFELEEAQNKITDYFIPYDYIVGDWSYGKLRLKGFCNKDNDIYKPINDIENLKKYLEENCPFNCKYFVLKRLD
mgnify:FL=1